MTEFLAQLEHLFYPIEGWGEFRRGARRAAVVFVLYQADGRWHVPFVRRRADLRDHPGQVALPGGGVQDGESA
ncbi:MAG TPA: NUDIX domain-containing protein, partial [Gemmatimonadales bacterium]|nr:NUDIX domain-containing protein [Gemmatimonadales bacterium]